MSNPYITTRNKDFNPSLLHEEIKTQLSTDIVVKWPGFKQKSKGVVTPDLSTSFPGKMGIASDVDLADLHADLNAILTVHDATQISAEQIRRQTEDADLDKIETLLANRANWAAADVQKGLALALRAILKLRGLIE